MLSNIKLLMLVRFPLPIRDIPKPPGTDLSLITLTDVFDRSQTVSFHLSVKQEVHTIILLVLGGEVQCTERVKKGIAL